MLSFGLYDQSDQVALHVLCVVSMLIVIIQLILSVWICPKVITLSGLHYILL